MPNVKVVDASALVLALVDEGTTGDLIRGKVTYVRLAAPHFVDLEVVAALRRQHQRQLMRDVTARKAIERLGRMSIKRHGHAPLLRRCWQLRDNVKTYDAAYVALAEALNVPLLTADARLGSAPGIRCEIELVT
jgi:predicted nucleic acid-binding protein